MPAIHRRQVISVVLALAILSLGAGCAAAQFQDILGGNALAPGGDASAAVGGPESLVSVFANFTPPDGDRPAMLSVTAHIEPPWYTYSTTQKPVAATPTRIEVEESNDYRVVGEFRPTLPPKIVHEGELTFEEFSGEVTWQAPLELRDGVTLDNLVIKGSAKIQICKVGSCLPPTRFDFEAAFLDTPEAPKSTGEYKHPLVHATLSGYLEPRVVEPGGTANLVITAEMPPGWHVYALERRDSGDLGYKPTLIALSNTSGFRLKSTTASEEPVEAPAQVPGLPDLRFYEGRVIWTTPIVIPKDTKPGKYPIEGFVGYQTCFEDARCDAPRGAKFSATIEVSAARETGTTALAFGDAKYGQAAQVAANQPEPIEGEAGAQTAAAPIGWTLPIIILAGLVGGFILNFMPCVLPVIGLKILSFAEQAGKSRATILVLNVWYSLGTLTVFMVLATLATAVSWGFASENLGWGQQFQSTTFNIVMVGIVFVMALSFLSVWEIPIPGFVGSGKATELAAREGAAGAFSKGVLATILATPCSGPALGPVFGYTLNQPPSITYLLFFCIALGMSGPYLLIGAFPTLIRFIPKPGAWMDTFKNLMGFVLLGTIAFLFSFMDRDYFVPTFTLMVGLWAACWWIGRTPLTENLSRKAAAWGQGAAFAALIGFFAFTWLVPRESIIPWQDFSQAELVRLRESGNTVLVDFTAEWCLTCKFNLATAIETEEVREALEKNKVVPLLADFTKESPAIKDALASLNSASIPVLAIYPADQPDKPIVLRDVITKQQVLNAIEKAGPSKNGAKLTASMP